MNDKIQNNQQGVKTILLFGAVWLIPFTLGTLSIWLVTGRSFPESFGIASAALAIIIFWGYFVVWFYSRNTGGAVLLDCGPNPARKVFLLYAAIFLILGSTQLYELPLPLSKVFSVGGIFFHYSFSMFWIISAMDRIQVRENGILMYSTLMHWKKIDSYHWESDSMVVIKSKGWIAYFSTGVIIIAPEKKAAFEELLQRYCPARNVT